MVGLKWLLLWCLWLTIPRIPSTKNVGKTYRFLCWCHRELQQCMATFLKRWIGMEVQSIRANKCQGKGWGVIYLMRCSLQVLQVKVWISVKAEWKYEVIKMLPRIWMKIKTVSCMYSLNTTCNYGMQDVTLWTTYIHWQDHHRMRHIVHGWFEQPYKCLYSVWSTLYYLVECKTTDNKVCMILTKNFWFMEGGTPALAAICLWSKRTLLPLI